MTTKHTGAAALIKDGYFDNLTSFDEFLQRSKTLPNSKMVGDYLEVLVEGLLYTHPTFQTKEVHQVGYIPSEIIKRMKFPKHFSLGLDGIQVTKTGQVIPYQVKNYNKESLTFGDVSSFLASVGVATNSMIFTSAATLNKNIKDREGLIGVTSSFFENLTAQDFNAFSNWLFDRKPVIYKTPKPWKHQTKLFNKFTQAFYTKNEDRANGIVGCGGGKTRIGYMLTRYVHRRVRKAKKRGAVVVVFVPNNNLLGQIRADYRKWGLDSYLELVVSSDNSISRKTGVDEDWELSDRVSDCIFPATTNEKEIRDFLNLDTDELRIIFSTYNSSRALARGLKGSKVKKLDLGIFDEAHRTCAKFFGFGLFNKEIPIDKRAFLTATARNLNTRDADGNVFNRSMDDESVYGHKLLTVTAKYLISVGATVPVHIMLSYTTNDDLDAYTMKRGYTEISDGTRTERVEIDWLAAQVAFNDARKRIKATKSMTFWHTVDQTNDWRDDFMGWRRTAEKGCGSYRVVGIDSTETRMNQTSEFEKNPKFSDLCTVHAASEGQNLPSVDMLFFPVAKQSVRAITQCVGRGGRSAVGKTEAYAVIATHVMPGETPYEAMARTGTDTIYRVIDKLMNEDDSFMEAINEIRFNIGAKRKITIKTGIKQKILVNAPSMDEDEILKSIVTEIAMRCGDDWFERLGECVEWHKNNGGWNVHPNTRSKNAFEMKVGKWETTQRQWNRTGYLTAARKTRLLKEGFLFTNPSELEFISKIEVVKTFKNKNGRYPAMNESCGRWLCTQRYYYNNQKIPKDRLVIMNRELGKGWIERQTGRGLSLTNRLKTFELKFHRNVKVLADSMKQQGRLPLHNEKGGRFLISTRYEYKKNPNKFPKHKMTALNAVCRGWEKPQSHGPKV